MKTISKPAFYDLRTPFLSDLEESYAGIKEDFSRVLTEKLYTNWPETFLYNEGWNVFGLRFQKNDIVAAHEICPVIAAFVKRHDRLIDTAGFSILQPGTVIKPHVGYTEDVLRCHLGIQIPQGDCELRVGGIPKKWEEGKAFIFDDTLEHEAWNKTNEVRIVMLMDLVKCEMPELL